MIPPENIIFEPARLMRAVVYHTHHFPDNWRDRVHLFEVQAQFAQLYDLKVSLFIEEVCRDVDDGT